MKTRVLVIALLFLSFRLHAADYYWVGGGGNWSELSHWRLGSPTGSIPSIVPAASDNVFFGSYSTFGTTTATKTVTLDANGYCNNMTWESTVANNPRLVSSSGTLSMEIRGNLVLSSTTTYNIVFAFRGTANNTISTNGRVLGAMSIDIDMTGGSLTVADSLIYTPGGSIAIRLTTGTLDIANKKILATSFISNSNNIRTLEMTNANLTIAGLGDFRWNGSNKTVNAAGSYLESYVMIIFGGTFNKVVCNGGTGTNQLNIGITAFSTLIFANSAASVAAIGAGNTVTDSLIFMGEGQMSTDNNIGYVYFSRQGQITGGGNIIRKIECKGQLLFNPALNHSHVNTIDSLLLAPNYLASLDGTLNINKYLYLMGATCEAFTEVNGDSTNGVVNFASGVVVDMSNALLTGVKATGPGIPFSVTGIDGGDNQGFSFTEPSIAGTTLYWIGGSGDWNDRSHWSTVSGGAGGACVPFINDNVIFDANSGLAGGTVTTSSSSFCRNMTWEPGVGTAIFNESATGTFRIYGSLAMQPNATLNAVLEFSGGSPASITTNGNTTGTLRFFIRKTSGAVVTLQDNWSNPVNGTIQLYSGGFNMAGRTVSFLFFASNYNLARSLNITNAIITTTYYWDYRGFNKTLQAAGSYITVNTTFHTDGQSYAKVDVTSAVNQSTISSTTVGQLTFTHPSATSLAFLGSSNTVRRLEFKGKGFIGTGNNIDSLLLAASQYYNIAGSITVNKYIKAESPGCSALLEMRGPGTIAFISGTEFHVNNVYMEKITATGPMVPIAFSGADAGGNTGWTITTPAGGDRYWVGGSGDWNDPAHWSATSGGAPGTACVPTVYDNVYFNAGSGFTSASKTVTISNGNAYCYNINWTGAANNPVFNKTSGLKWEVWGTSVIFNPATTIQTPGAADFLTLKGSNATILQGNAPAGNFSTEIDKPGGSLTLQNNYSNANTVFAVTNGTFNASGRTLNVNAITNSGLSNASTINISNATITTSTWQYTGNPALHTLNAANSTITTVVFAANGLTYNSVNVSGNVLANTDMNNATIDSLIFTNPSTTSTVGINGANNLLNYVEYKGSGGIYGTNNTIDTLVFFPGNRYALNSGTNTTITGEWYGSGTPCRLTEIVSSSTTNATVTKTSGSVNFDYVRLQRITGAGGATYSTQSHSVDQGGNTGWTMAPYNGAAPIYGLGPDTAVAPADFPITLRTDGFFGDPSSQYVWNDNSTADTLLVTGPGTYSVQVNFVDGCNISDAITVSNASTLPITLGHFAARLQDNCSGVQLNWITSSEQNSKNFTIQRSSNGSSWATIGTIAAAGNSNVQQYYSYTDAGVSGGAYFYRLQLNDLDGRQKMSKVVSVQLDCAMGKFFIYPNPVQDVMTIQAPAGGGQKLLTVYTSTGQRVLQTTIQPGEVKNIPASQWKQGLYMVIITENGQQVYMQKVSKQ